jgi:hypothetical protein
MRQSNHVGSEVHTVVLTDAVLPPITFSYSLKAAAAMFADAAATLRSPPQNATALQGGNHAIAEDCTRRPSAVGAGQYDVLRDMQSGEGAKP